MMTAHRTPEPVLLAYELEDTVRFYKEQLGFSIIHQEDSVLAERDDMTIRLGVVSKDVDISGMTAILRTDNVRAVHTEYRATGIPSVTNLLTTRKKPLQFSLKDINGNYLLFVGPQPELAILPGSLAAIARDRQYA
ncbi:hypothetical protein [Coralliovum pocilloporae]|uniref:hypothetical protein n=1 Tax=Coralliovum pocilloporae TaxID=3066369 RepID=UPI00330735C3